MCKYFNLFSFLKVFCLSDFILFLDKLRIWSCFKVVKRDVFRCIILFLVRFSFFKEFIVMVSLCIVCILLKVKFYLCKD